jgi:hypothetical protein
MTSLSSRTNRRRRYVVVTVAVLMLLVGLRAWWIPSDDIHTSASSKITVDKTTLTFDPGTCTEGHGTFYWSMGSCSVAVLRHEGNHCLFEHTEEIEMGASVYLVKVPITSGPVTVKIANITRDGSTYDWPVTSFPLSEAKVVRQGGGRGIWTYRVGDAEAFVTVLPSETRSEMVPKKGDVAKFQFQLFTDGEFKESLPGAVFRPTAEFVVGSEEDWPWLRIATEGMAVGDRRQVEVPVEVVQGAKEWLPKDSNATVLYIEVGLISIRRAAHE